MEEQNKKFKKEVTNVINSILRHKIVNNFGELADENIVILDAKFYVYDESIKNILKSYNLDNEIIPMVTMEKTSIHVDWYYQDEKITPLENDFLYKSDYLLLDLLKKVSSQKTARPSFMEEGFINDVNDGLVS